MCPHDDSRYRETMDGSPQTIVVSSAVETTRVAAAVLGSPIPTDGAERYARRSLLGRGGMGEVFVCRDDRIGRDVALKRLYPDQSDLERPRVRFLREARVQGQLEHPSIVPVYDLGLDADGSPFFTMRRVRGHSLEHILHELAQGVPDMVQRYSQRKLLDAFSRVCLAVDYAHRRGVVHRDLKPANLMLGDFGEVYVLDWGLAKIEDAAAEELSTSEARISAPAPERGLTQAGAILGTPGYSAPEQLTEAARADARADVYALGAILFEILTLQPLHPREATPVAAIAASLRAADARPSVRAPDRGAPPELEAACVRATALDRADRFADARALHDAIERYMEGDRDVELRRRMASEHAEEARRVLAAEGSGEAARSHALTELGRALALDPRHAGAREALVRLLLEPPREVPAEVSTQLHAAALRTRRLGGVAGASAYAAWLAAVPLMIAAGIQSWAAVLAMMIPAVVAAASSLTSFLVKDERLYTPSYVANIVFSALTIAATSALFGPFIIVPSVAAANVVALALVAPRRRHIWILTVASSCAAVLVPLLLQWVGVLPAFYSFEGGSMIVRAGAMRLAEVPSYLLLLTGSVMPVLVPGLFAGRVRAALDQAQVENALHAWHMKQLMPRGPAAAEA